VNEIERLLNKYERFVALPWDRTLAGPQRVWFVMYDPTQERRLRLQLEAFQVVTEQAQHRWTLVDLTDTFAHWMAQHEYREAYFEQPEDMDLALDDYAAQVVELVQNALTASDTDDQTMVALLGIGSLFGLMRASVLIERVAPFIRGRLLVFFPGHKEGASYRLLDARDSWNYSAVAITADEE